MRLVAIALLFLFSPSAFADDVPARHAGAWTETKWPFLIDQWGLGQAYQCKAADCGIEVTIYLRAKVGFCNCTTGITEDDEIDRVGDIEPRRLAVARGRARRTDHGRLDEGPQPCLRGRGARPARTTCAHRRGVEQMRRRGRDGGCGSADFVRYRAGRHGFPRQPTGPAMGRSQYGPVAHDPEKAGPGLDLGWPPVFGSDHAQSKS